MDSFGLTPEQKFLVKVLNESFKVINEIGEGGQGMENTTNFVLETAEAGRIEELIREADGIWLEDLEIDPESLQ